MLQGRDAEAIQFTQRASELDPRSVLLQINRAVGLAGLGSFDEALAALDKVRDIDPLSPWPDAQIAAIHATVFGRLDVAIPFLQRAIELDPSGDQHTARLAQVYLDLGDHEQAEQLLEHSSGGHAAFTTRGMLQLYRGEREKALASARLALEIEPRHRLPLALLRDADLQAQAAGAARSRYKAAFPELFDLPAPAVDRSNYGVAIDLALVLQATGERARATQLLDQAEGLLRANIRLGPWGYQVSDAQVHALRGHRAEALLALRDAQKSQWRGPDWRYYRDFDPSLATLRSDPEFKAVFADIERNLRRQRAGIAQRPPAG